jgi:hypothetical protein
MLLADLSSVLGSIWFALLLGCIGVGFGFYTCRKSKVK